MRYVFDLTGIIASKWKNSKKLVAMTILNLTVGLCMFTIFTNIGLNVNNYLKDNFFSNERLNHVLVKKNSNTPISFDSQFIIDKNVDNKRIILDSNVEVNTVGGKDYSSVIGLDLTILQADELIFDGEYSANEMFKESQPEWENGVILSEKCLAIFSNLNPIGQYVSFKFSGKNYSLPITAIIASSAEENFDYEYKSFMYVFSDALKIHPDTFEFADIRINAIENVKCFIDKYDSEDYKVISNISEIEHILNLSKLVFIFLIVIGSLFALFSTIGIRNSLTYMQDVNIRNLSLLKVVGFSNADIKLINLLESLYIGIISFVFSSIVFAIVSEIIKMSHLFEFSFINTEGLFKINFLIFAISFLVSLLIIILCKFCSIKNVRMDNLLDTIKNER